MKKEEIKKKIKQLEEQIFYHEMKDNWTKDDFELAEKLELELKSLKESISHEHDN